MIPRLRICLVALGVIVLAPLAARGGDLDDTIVALMQKRHVPGLSLAIIQDGKIVKARGYGVTEGGGDNPVTQETLFQAGSVSKPVAALGALRLVEAGQVALEADVNTALTSWQVPENEFTKSAKVTLRGLLSHTAGLTVHGFPGYAVGAAVPTLVQVLNGEPPANTPPIRVDVAPGSIWRYAGGGYTVMQQLLIDVTGRPFPDYMRETVLLPLGMAASTFEQPLPAALAAKTATGHTARGGPVPGRWHIYPEMAAAGLWTTPSDLARFVIAVQHALAGQSDAVVSPATALLMVTPVKGDYGLGFSVAGSGGTRRFSHGGRDEGFDMQLMAYRDTGQGAVIMINANENSSFMKQVLAAIVKAYDWPDYEPYKRPAAIEDKEPAVTAQVKTIFAQAQKGTFDRDLYTPKLADLIDASLRGEGREFLRGLGALQSIELVERRDRNGMRTYRYRLIYADHALLVFVAYDPENKIAGLNFLPE